ncbi:MAG: hypothetical protein IPM86_10330 [Saprospiraceae bacterium]|nr:hypothetical protein [Saprospiraceae bacterium]
MEYKRSWLFLMPSFILVICLTAYCRTEPEPKSREGLLLKSVYDILQGYHYSPQNVNDDFSQTVFKEYLLNLDAGKRLFTSQDLKLLESERMLIDDQFKNGETSFFDKSNDLMDKALEKAESYFIHTLICLSYSNQKRTFLWMKRPDHTQEMMLSSRISGENQSNMN